MDSVTDENIWAKRYDSSLDDFFKVQDEVTRKIVTALEVKLAPEDQKHLTRTDTVKIDAYDHLLRGLDYYSRRTIADNQHAVKDSHMQVQCLCRAMRMISFPNLSRLSITGIGIVIPKILKSKGGIGILTSIISPNRSPRNQFKVSVKNVITSSIKSFIPSIMSFILRIS